MQHDNRTLLHAINVKKTAVYTNFNGDLVIDTSKTAKIKKMILPSNTSPNVNVNFGSTSLAALTFICEDLVARHTHTYYRYTHCQQRRN